MFALTFEAVANKALISLSRERYIMLATSLNDKVMIKQISQITHKTAIYFVINNTSEEYSQLKHNHNVAFAVKRMQFEAIAEICGHPTQDSDFCKRYKKRFSESFGEGVDSIREVLVRAFITKIRFHEISSGEIWIDTVDFIKRIAYREPSECIRVYDPHHYI